MQTRTLITKEYLLEYILILLVLFSIGLFTSFMMENKDQFQQEVTTVVPLTTTEDSVADHIRKQNKKLEDDIVTELATAIVKESKKHRIPINIMIGIISVESNFDQYAISNMGAMGFWQVLPRWHYDKIRKLHDKNLYDPAVNTKLGAQILKDCMSKFQKQENMYAHALQCYNGAPNDTTFKYAAKVFAQTSNI